MPTPIPLDPKEFRTLLVQTAAVICSGLLASSERYKKKDGSTLGFNEYSKLSVDTYAAGILEAAGFVEGVDVKLCLDSSEGDPCLQPRPCQYHSKPATCGYPFGFDEGKTRGNNCGRPLPCSIHG